MIRFPDGCKATHDAMQSAVRPQIDQIGINDGIDRRFDSERCYTKNAVNADTAFDVTLTQRAYSVALIRCAHDSLTGRKNLTVAYAIE
jgi:hypothetical protein